MKQLLQLLPSNSKASKEGYNTDDEIEGGFAGIIFCSYVNSMPNSWIIDSGASHHMVRDFKRLIDPVKLQKELRIIMLDGKSYCVTHMGSLKLGDILELSNVLCAPDFKYNKCSVTFKSDICLIQDCHSLKVKALGRMTNGLF